LLLRREFRIRVFAILSLLLAACFSTRNKQQPKRKQKRIFFGVFLKKKFGTVYIVFYQQLPAAIIVARSLLLLHARVIGLGFVESLRSIGAHFDIIFGSSFVDLGFGFPRTKSIMGSLMAGWSTNPLDAQSGLYSNL
jgi:hypothetical protein